MTSRPLLTGDLVFVRPKDGGGLVIVADSYSRTTLDAATLCIVLGARPSTSPEHQATWVLTTAGDVACVYNEDLVLLEVSYGIYDRPVRRWFDGRDRVRQEHGS